MKTTTHRLPSFLLALAFALTLHAQVVIPPLINYQGRVAVDGVNFDGAGSFKFALVDEAGGTTFWSNDLSSANGSEPAAAVTLTVAKGLYTVLLGDVSLANMAGLTPDIFANPDVRLRVWFDDGVHGSQLLTPDQRIAPAAYLADGTVTSASIGMGAVNSANIAAGAINATHVAPGSLDFSLLTVPSPPSAGQVLGFDGAALNWVAPSVVMGGDSVFSLNGTSAYYTGGRVGIGTSAPTTKLTVYTQIGSYAFGTTPGLLHTDGNVSVGTSIGTFGFADGAGVGTFSNHPLNFFVNNGPPSMTINGNGTTVGAGNGAVSFGSPNAESGMTFTRAGFSTRADVRYDGTTLRLFTGPAGQIPSSGVAISNGLVQLPSSVQLAAGTNGYQVGFGSPNSEDGLTLSGAGGRADLRYDGTLKLVNGGGGIPLATNGIAINTAGNVGIGTTSPSAKLHVVGTMKTSVLSITGGADLAEPFAMTQRSVPAGTVVCIDPEHPGKLRKSTAAYDRKVAGIVSGANGIHPGISMIDEQQLEPGENVALSGRVYVKANTSAGPIAPGDLLTTSEISGEAMKAADHQRAQGSILGKAMTPLDESTGMVLVLVTLQ